ncbi:hypothetical protein CBR_g39691 [Chara braunii]|uniref:Integrase catalytic domain-containing protein n=1 Tax=Chara braunii TaxID=69332 RepID=A0A388LS91_CHABU|nr:hypothetical protein CBR_g39691 [Chara braunii]|eukprot:GBG85125.1 hypothetical protein CBR_g39691 [Chara braunii]
MNDWAQTHTLESFMDLVEARWHNPQQAQIATDGILKLDSRKYKSVRELTTTVERLIVVPGVEYNPQVLLTTFLRCLPTDIRNLLASEARKEYHTFETFSKKALDLEATLGGAHTPSADGRKKKIPHEWQKKGNRLMMVDFEGNRTEIDDVSKLVGGKKLDGEESAKGSNLAAIVKTKAVGRGKGGQQRSQGQVADPNKIAAWVRAGALILSEDVTRSLDEVYKEDPITMDIINKQQAKDKATTDEFVMVDELLFLEKAGFKRLVVPSRETLRSLFLDECHDATGHFGDKKSSANLVQRFWWPNMLDDVKKYVETCQVCQRDMLRTQARGGLLKPLPIPAGTGQSISMDFMDTLVTSKNGKRHIFVIVDRFTKDARLIAMPESAKIEHVIKLFMDNGQAQIATDGLLKLDTRKYKFVREVTTTVERLIVILGVEYNPQVLLTMFLRCLPTYIRNLLASEARREYHTFESFNKKALDLEATLGGAQTPSTDGRKKKTPQEWKKGSRLMMVDSDGNQTEIDDAFELVEGSEFDGEENAEGSNLAAVVKTKAGGRDKGGQQKSQGQASNPNKIAAWVRAGLDQDVWRDRWFRGACINCGTFQHAMNRIFHDHLDKFVVVYLDDILIFSRYAEEHAQHVDTVLSLLRQHKYKIDVEKCEFGRTQILYLGHEVFADGIRPEDAKVASIRDWPRPQSLTEVRSFLGMCGYYRNFVKKYSTIASPLTDSRLDTPWDWTDECKATFNRLKHALTHHEVLMVPDPQRPFVVTIDASQYGIGAVLAQQDGKKLRPIEYMTTKRPSKKFAKSTYKRELYALYKEGTCPLEALFVRKRDKPRTQAPLGLLKPLPIPAGPGQSISMDSLVTSKNGKRHIFVIVDRFTKYARLIAMPETDRTEHVIKLFMDNWVRDFGLPKTIVSDRDVRFTSEMWKKAIEQMGSQLQTTFGNYPEANGQAEQMNRVVQHLLKHYIKPCHLLKHYIKPSQDAWDEKLPLIVSLYNNAVHSTTGVGPNQLNLGWKPRSALDFLLPENRTAATPGTIEFGVQYEKLLQKAVEHIKKSKEAMIASENKRCRQSTFQIGERVWVKASELGQEFGISRKLMPLYFGPWEVLDIVGNDLDGPSYIIPIPGHLRTYPVFHASKLAPFAETAQFPSRRSMLPPTMDGHVDVNDILDHRDPPVPKPPGRGRPPKPAREYRVHFRHEDRWISREELVKTAPQIVADYEKKLKGRAPA